MKHKKTITSIVLLLLGFGGLQAQESPTATSGEATGSSGIASYSIGTIVYTTNIGTNGSVAQGVQQPYEVFTTLGLNETTINLELIVYPNPTKDFLILKVEKTEDLMIQLVDLLGKVIISKTINSTSTKINLDAQPSAIYFLKVTKNNKPVKIFKIIKK